MSDALTVLEYSDRFSLVEDIRRNDDLASMVLATAFGQAGVDAEYKGLLGLRWGTRQGAALRQLAAFTAIKLMSATSDFLSAVAISKDAFADAVKLNPLDVPGWATTTAKSFVGRAWQVFKPIKQCVASAQKAIKLGGRLLAFNSDAVTAGPPLAVQYQVKSAYTATYVLMFGCASTGSGCASVTNAALAWTPIKSVDNRVLGIFKSRRLAFVDTDVFDDVVPD